tara:strand:- start:6119 stop:6292 length:174 start_codon:yes stop_codon:yes gene_type:complete
MVIEFPTTEMIDLDKTIHALQKAKESGFVMFSPVMVKGDYNIKTDDCDDKLRLVFST